MSLGNKILSFLKKRKYVYGVLVLVLIIGGIVLFRNGKNTEKTIIVLHSDFVNRVSVSGKVVAAKDVELAFGNGGPVERINFLVGEEAKANSLIAKVDTKDAEKTILDAEVDLASAKLASEKIELESSNKNLSSDLQKAYDEGFVSVSNTFSDLPGVVNGIADLFGQNDLSDNTARLSGNLALQYRNTAEFLYYKAKAAYNESRVNFRTLNQDSNKTEIDAIIDETYETVKLFSDAIKSLRNFIDYLAEDLSQESSYITYQSTVSGYSDIISEHFSELLSSKISIQNYKDIFPSTDMDMQDLLLAVKEKENALRNAKAELEDYYIRAPFTGIITKIDAKIGEIAIANTPLVSMINVGVFQIESYVPEVNIAQIKLGDKSEITLDAYGENVIFDAEVISIDPAETIRDGVSTYKIKLQFSEKDNRIKPGMTANVNIQTFYKPNVIVLPGGVVFEKDGKKFVQVKTDDGISNREVTTGSISVLGQVEIESGLSDGELVVVNPKIN